MPTVLSASANETLWWREGRDHSLGLTVSITNSLGTGWELEVWTGTNCGGATRSGSMSTDGFEFFPAPDEDTVWYVLSAGAGPAQLELQTDML